MHLARMGGQQRTLTRLQTSRQINNRVALAQRAQRVQQLQRQRARARAKLPDFSRAGCLQRLGHLPRQRLAESRRQLGRRYKITAAFLRPVQARRHQAEFARVVGVITQTRRIQRQRHAFVEAQPAVSTGDGLANRSVEVGR